MRHAVRALILNREGKCLFVQHYERIAEDQGKWSSVGGGIDEGEDHQTCLLRELGEEFGDSLVGKIVIGPQVFVNQRSYRVDYFYVVWFEGDDVMVKATDEILGHRWFSPEEASELKTFFGVEAGLYMEAAQLPRSNPTAT